MAGVTRRVWKYALIPFLALINGCSGQQEEEPAVGMLMTYGVEDQEWNQQGYNGVMQLQEQLNADVHVKEHIDSFSEAEEAVETLEEEGVTLLFGHGAVYADIFMNIKDDYEHIHFVAFNEHVSGSNITSVQFDGYAMGYFAGMIAAEQSETGSVASIAAYPYQPEVRGFAEGAAAHGAEAALRFTGSWVDDEEAQLLFDEVTAGGSDIVYPAGDGFHEGIIEKAREQNIFTVGYLNEDFKEESTVLTSTIQHVEELYIQVAEAYVQGDLESGNHVYDFEDELISLAPFSPEMDEEAVRRVTEAVEYYKETGLLPFEQEQEEGVS
nr:BMP family ABC transporter substrate-binding protein [Alkalicoccus halolimnae]